MTTDESRALTVPVESEWLVMRDQAAMMVKSGFFPKSIRTAEQALAVMMLGRELGIGPAAALNSINVIDGKPTISAQLALALFIRSGERELSEITGDATQCTVTLKRNGQPAHTEVFTMADAERLGLSTKDNWRKQPAVMLRWRTVMACLRIVAPDILQGVYSPDEMGREEHARSTAWRILDDETGEILFEDAPAAAAVIATQAGYDIVEAEFKEVEQAPTGNNGLDAFTALLNKI